MNLAQQIIYAGGFGSGRYPAGSHQTNTYQPSPEETVAKTGTGKRYSQDGIQVYLTNGKDVDKVGANTLAIIAGRNALQYHDTSSGTKYSYKGQTTRASNADEAIKWAVMQHIKQQEFRQRQRDKSSGKSDYRPIWSQVDRAIRSARKAVRALTSHDLGMGMKTPAAQLRFRKTTKTI